jgi:hypothetical protein
VATYTSAVAQIPSAVSDNSGTGPCDVFTPDGKRNPDPETYLQKVVDAYFARIVEVCSRHPNCYTDEGAMQSMSLTADDITPDHNHLSVQGLHAMAALAWKVLPDQIKNRA